MAACGPALTAMGCGASNHGQLRLYTVADGLSSNQIRSLVEGTDGTLWIGTFGGGLDALRNGQFFHVTARDGLLSDNVSHIEDDGQGSLWLSTTRGICRVRKQEIWDLIERQDPKSRASKLRRGGRVAQRAVRSRISHQRRGHAKQRWTLVVSYQPRLGRARSERSAGCGGGAGGSFARGRRGRTSHPGYAKARGSRLATAACSSDTRASISALPSACVIRIGWKDWMASGSARWRGA